MTDTDTASVVDRALATFKGGNPIVVYDADDREGEADLIYAAAAVTPDVVARLRNDAGGLICTALGHEIAEIFDLPYLNDSIDHGASNELDLGYDERSSFSLSVNHRDTYTGITDKNRSRTITALADAAARPEKTDFAAEFRSPGHVNILKAASNGLTDRHGHTEMAVELARAAGYAPASVVCEMLDDETGTELSKEDAQQYAKKNGFVFLEGIDIIKRYS